MSADEAHQAPAQNDAASLEHAPAEDDCAVQVAVHIRPLIGSEQEAGCQESLFVTPEAPRIAIGAHTFNYDYAFGSAGGEPASGLYQKCVQPLVAGLFKGYSATVLAYGQTGSGKTYTMGSAFSFGRTSNGVIPNVMDTLFRHIAETDNVEYTVRVGFVEIHQETIRDLLVADASAQPAVHIREVAGGGVCLAGAREQEVGSHADMAAILEQGTLMRATAATGMNRHSSRSHAVFTITLEQRRQVPQLPHERSEDGDDPSSGGDSEADGDTVEEYLCAKMHLVDLAGSERVKRTRAEGARLAEGISINRGLLALGNVICALSEGHKHVPYRDSKLTRMLQDSLGGNSRTVMIACVSPADVNLEESLNTLRYAARARNIRNKPVVNRDPNAAQVAVLRQQLSAARAEAAALRRALHEAQRGVGPAAGGGAISAAALEQAQARAETMEADAERLRVQLEEARTEAQQARRKAAAAQARAEHLEAALRDVRQRHGESVEAGLPPADQEVADRIERIAELEAQVTTLQRVQQQPTQPRPKALHKRRRLADDSGGSSPNCSGDGSVADWQLSDSAADDEAGSGSDDDSPAAEQHRQEQARLQAELTALDAAHAARVADMEALTAGRSRVSALTVHYDKVLADLASERDALQRDRASLLQKMAAVETASAEERERLRVTYKQRLHDMDARLKALQQKAAAAAQLARLKARSEATCDRLKSDITSIRQQKVQLMRQIEKSQREWAEGRRQRDKEILQLRRKGMRTEVQMARQAALMQRQQAVLRRKLQEADASRKRLVRSEGLRRAAKETRPVAPPAEHNPEECQPNSSAPLLRDEGARRSWVEQEIAACCTAQDLRRVLEGEKAARSEAMRRLREAEKAAAAATAPALPLSPAAPGLTPPPPAGGALEARRGALQAAVDEHSRQIADIMARLCAARTEDEARGGGAADARRWTALRTPVEARGMLKTVFRAAADHAAQVLDLDMALTEVREEAELLRLRLHIARAERDAARGASGHPAALSAAPPPSLTGHADSEVATLMRELEGLGALEAGLPADSPAAGGVAAATAGSPAAGGHAAHSPTLSLPAASAWVPVGSRSASTSPAAGAAAAAAALRAFPQSACVPSPLAAASAAASPASHNCFRPVSEGSCSPGIAGSDSGAAPPCTPVGSRSSRLGPVAGQSSLPSPAASELSLAAATPLHSPAAEPAATALGEAGEDGVACEHAQPAGVADGSAGRERLLGGEDGSSDSSSDSDAKSDAQDGTWLPEFATPAQRRPTRRVRLRVPGTGSSRTSGGRRRSGSAFAASGGRRSNVQQASREALLLSAVNAERRAAGREALPRLTMRALRGFLHGKTVGGRPWTPPASRRRDELVTDAMHYLGWSTAASGQQAVDGGGSPGPTTQQPPAAEAEQAAAAWRMAAAQLPGSEADEADGTPVVCRTRSRSRGATGDSISGDGGASASAAAAASSGGAADMQQPSGSPGGVRGRLSVELPADPSAAGAQAAGGAESPGTPSPQRGRPGGSRPAELRHQLVLRGVAAASSPGRASPGQSPGKSPSKGTGAPRPAFGDVGNKVTAAPSDGRTAGLGATADWRHGLRTASKASAKRAWF